MRTNARVEREEKKLLKMWANSLLAADIISPTVFQIRSERKILQTPSVRGKKLLKVLKVSS